MATDCTRNSSLAENENNNKKKQPLKNDILIN